VGSNGSSNEDGGRTCGRSQFPSVHDVVTGAPCCRNTIFTQVIIKAFVYLAARPYSAPASASLSDRFHILPQHTFFLFIQSRSSGFFDGHMAVCINWQGRDGTILECPHGRSTSARDEGIRVVWNYSSGALLVRYDVRPCTPLLEKRRKVGNRKEVRPNFSR
jgi:hypothetical protein